jgi:hypothetical protein
MNCNIRILYEDDGSATVFILHHMTLEDSHEGESAGTWKEAVVVHLKVLPKNLSAETQNTHTHARETSVQEVTGRKGNWVIPRPSRMQIRILTAV